MKYSNRNQQNLIVAASMGFAGFALRALLYRIGFDDRNILSSTHPLHRITVVLTIAATVYLAFRVRKPQDTAEFRFPWARFLAGGLGGYFLLIHGLSLVRQTDGLLAWVRCFLALVGAAAMVVTVFPAFHDRKLHMVCHGLICLFFAADMLCRYRSWSGNPQLPDYCFHVLAGVCLSLCSYHRLAFDTGLAKPRIHSFCCLMAVYLCLLCLIGPEGWEFYLGGAFWAVACLFTPEAPEAEKEEADVPA